MNSKPVICPNPHCHAVIGEVVNIDGLVMLRIGVLLVRETQAVCIQCGRMFYWSVSNKIITRILMREMTKNNM